MANSKYEYTRTFESHPTLLPQTWIVIRLDGRGFTRLAQHYNFTKPNDRRALDCMNAAAVSVLRQFPDVCVAYGHSDEFSFVLHPSCELFSRREAKIVSTLCSAFTSAYVFCWGSFFGETVLKEDRLPCFDARAVCYPSESTLRDYMSWRQVDCHVNNLYNTCFWSLVGSGLDNVAAERELMGTFSADKNELLFSRFGINYNNEPEMFRKGSVVFRDVERIEQRTEDQEQGQAPRSAERGSKEEEEAKVISKTQAERERKQRMKARIAVEHLDIIKDEFWLQRPWILKGKPPPKG